VARHEINGDESRVAAFDLWTGSVNANPSLIEQWVPAGIPYDRIAVSRRAVRRSCACAVTRKTSRGAFRIIRQWWLEDVGHATRGKIRGIKKERVEQFDWTS